MSFPLLVQQSKVFSTSTSRAFHGFPMDFKDHPGPWRCWWTPVPWRSPAPSSIYGKIYVGVPPQVECQPAPVKHFREIPEANGDLKMENQCLHHLVWWICSIAMICYMICHDWFFPDGILVFRSVFSLAAVAISGAKFEEDHVFLNGNVLKPHCSIFLPSVLQSKCMAMQRRELHKGRCLQAWNGLRLSFSSVALPCRSFGGLQSAWHSGLKFFSDSK